MHRARTFLYVAAGLFLLAATVALVTTTAKGQGAAFRVIGVGVVVVGDTAYYLDEANEPVGWRQLPWSYMRLPPVPPSSLVYLAIGRAITDTGEGWCFASSGWTNVGQVPGIVSTQRSTWGQLKAKYREPVPQTEKVGER
jgi:hypothetical protein